MKNLLRILSFILKHPIGKKNKFISIKNFFSWQFGQILLPYPICYPFIENTVLLVSKDMTGATGNIYVSLHEFNEMTFLLHFLKPDDIFVDVGANIGSYTILASGVIGAYSITIEPIPSTFKTLLKNIYLNNIAEKVSAHNVGAGAKESMLYFTNNYDTVNHVVLNPVDSSNLVEIPITILDNLLLPANSPSLIKIDVEGFETEVLKGAMELLKNISLKAIIIELLGNGGSFGVDEKNIHNILLGYGFEAYIYEPFARNLILAKQFGKGDNTLYIRDINFVKYRLQSARKFRVLTNYI